MLELGHNQVADLTPLAALEQLDVLYLPGNRITDLEPLLGLPRLTILEIWDNPLGPAALHEQIPALRSRGVEVYW